MDMHNTFQKEFLNALRSIQETSVATNLLKTDAGDSLEDRLYAVSADVIIGMMELLDGYSDACSEKLDIVRKADGANLREAPFIELHDAVCEYIKFEK